MDQQVALPGRSHSGDTAGWIAVRAANLAERLAAPRRLARDLFHIEDRLASLSGLSDRTEGRSSLYFSLSNQPWVQTSRERMTYPKLASCL
jgi:hypothetical protein